MEVFLSEEYCEKLRSLGTQRFKISQICQSIHFAGRCLSLGTFKNNDADGDISNAIRMMMMVIIIGYNMPLGDGDDHDDDDNGGDVKYAGTPLAHLVLRYFVLRSRLSSLIPRHHLNIIITFLGVVMIVMAIIIIISIQIAIITIVHYCILLHVITITIEPQ